MIEGDIFYEPYNHNNLYTFKDSKIQKINNILKYLETLSKLGYEDKCVCKFIDVLTNYFSNKCEMIVGSITKESIIKNSEYPKNYIPDQLKFYLIRELFSYYVPTIIPDKYGLLGKARGLYSIVNKNDFYLLDKNSLDNFQNFFSSYITLKKEFDDSLSKEKNSCLKKYNEKISRAEKSVKKYESYKRFSCDYNEIIENKKTIISKYLESYFFVRYTLEQSCDELNRYIRELYAEVDSKNKQVLEIVNYMDQRMLRLKSITPKEMTFNEKELVHKLGTIADKEEFDKLYSLVYAMFTEHIYDDEKIKNNLITKRKLNLIKKRIDVMYNYAVYHYLDANNSDIKDCAYGIMQNVIYGSDVSFEPSGLAQLGFYDYKKDYRVLNEAINGNNIVPQNNVYIPRLDNKNFNRGYAYPLLELTFEHENIEINELTKNVMQDGELDMDYNTFLYQYMSFNTYIKNSDYIGKNFITNDFHNIDSQDFSNSRLLFSYNGILLIETNGEYEVVSHETVTMAGYDIPIPDKLKSSVIDRYKESIICEMGYIARSFRDEDSSLNKVNPIKPILV